MEKNIILDFNGDITQSIITSSVETLENNIENIGMIGKIVTISIELMQNMMTYSKTDLLNCRDIKGYGSLKITQNDDIFTIQSKNIISIEDKIKIEPTLIEIQSLDLAGIKKRYKELRKSGENAHDNNGGIGFYEIAKVAATSSYEFIQINEEKYYFIQTLDIQPKKK